MIKSNNKTNTTPLRKTIIATMAMVLTVPVLSIDAPTKKGDGFVNVNDRKEYRYETRPEMVFWREGGRPYWKGTEAMQSSNTLNQDNFKRVWSPEERIRFEMEQAKLDATDKSSLKDLASELKAQNSEVEEVWIMGFASKPGSVAYNQKLSEKRARNVKNFLVSQGVSPTMIKTSAYGESMALDNRKAGRRVEIKIMEI
jgi:outer membrane protein OmpA-like peptidoglycan-associated protein